jgi:Ca2+-binding EF-hand superfamily protein
MNIRSNRIIATQTAANRALVGKTTALIFAFLIVAGTAACPAAAGGTAPGQSRAKIDVNGDGVIDRSEAAAHPNMAENFDRFDKNKDGRIDAAERPQRHGKGRGGQGGERGERMAKLDANGDGRFSREELAGRERALQNFSAIDADKDGFLSREEMRAYHQKNGGRQRSAPK